MSARRPGPRRRRPAAWLRRLGRGERVMAIAMLAILFGGLGLIGQGMWLKMTAAQAAPAGYVHSQDQEVHPSGPATALR